MTGITRRRFIAITGAAAGLELLPFGSLAAAGAEAVTWRGVALGAVASLQIHHHDRPAAERLVAQSIAEVRRLERIFSLYRDDSSLVALNRHGVLMAPPQELVELLGEGKRVADLTGGVFDPTVQPLWTLYADHFSRPDADPGGPPAADIARALDKVGFDKVLVHQDRIAFARRGMALTLNGIAQGYITDRVVALLRAGGIDHSLIDLGEPRALGSHPDGRAWEVAIADPDEARRTAAVLPIVDRAVATSGADGFRFDPEGRFNHLFDPASGRCAHRYRSVTAVARTAVRADAYSTAFSLMSDEQIRALMPGAGIERVDLIGKSGIVSELVG
jgi:thiamine biosynthesis lipoprotein